jgi:hypothetical protein
VENYVDNFGLLVFTIKSLLNQILDKKADMWINMDLNTLCICKALLKKRLVKHLPCG